MKKRPQELTEQYVWQIDRHLDDLLLGKAVNMLEIEDFSDLLFVHPTHLSNTIKEVTGTSACGIYQMKIMEVALKLLSDPSRSIHDVALTLTYDPSQFTKWFKRLQGITPKEFRKKLTSSHPG